MPLQEIAAGVFHLPVGIANVYFVGDSAGPWTLIDTGLPGNARTIAQSAASLYGAGARPEAILLTHGHWDHAGNASTLSDLWDVPIVVHPLELPYLTGQSNYPPPDPTVGGFIATYSRIVKMRPCDLGPRVQTLEAGLDAPGLPGWEWHHTPGHSPGHVAFFRRCDHTLIAGDAITTMNLNSLFAAALRLQRVCGPPAPFTPDWPSARESVRLLAGLQPLTIAAGHGIPMSGGQAVMELAELAINFPMPDKGRYVAEPALTDETGVVSLPPKPPDSLPAVALALGAAAAAGTMFAVAAHRRKRSVTS
jgi:glyoxylase-like metal-dependent hydrolase (beta-lactamase superfamily II)